jgi:hypothetical protein
VNEQAAYIEPRLLGECAKGGEDGLLLHLSNLMEVWNVSREIFFR